MQTHLIRTTDTLTGIAARYYGDATRWREIAAANDLRPPYISADPLDQYGPALLRQALGAPIAAGQLTIAIAGDAAILRPGARVVLDRTLTSGDRLLDVCAIASYAAGALTLAAAPANAYPIGSVLRVYPPAADLRGVVARPGDRLLVPDVGTDATTTTDVADRYGRDIMADRFGRLTLTAAGDLGLIAGLANLAQQLRHRLRCERGAMVRHPSYGCPAQAYIGQATGPALTALLQSAIAEALTDDPRVGSVGGVDVVTTGEAVLVTAHVVAAGETLDLIASFEG